MNGVSLSIKQLLLDSWEVLKRSPGLVYAFYGVSIAWSLVFSLISNTLGDQTAVVLVIGLVNFLVNMLVTLFGIHLMLGLVDGTYQRVDEFGAALSDYMRRPLGSMILAYLGASLIYMVAVLAGTLLLIVPGVIVGIMLQFYSYLIVDKQSGAVESLQVSKQLTNGKKWWLFKFGLMAALLNVGGALLLLVGLLVTVPVSSLALVLVYRRLVGGEVKTNETVQQQVEQQPMSQDAPAMPEMGQV